MKNLVIFTAVFSFFSIFGFPSPVVNFSIETVEAATKAQWRNARRACQKKYGKRLIKTSLRKDGKFICRYRTSNRRVTKSSTYAEVIKICRQQYKGNVAVNAYRRYGKWYCSWRE